MELEIGRNVFIEKGSKILPSVTPKLFFGDEITNVKGINFIARNSIKIQNYLQIIRLLHETKSSQRFVVNLARISFSLSLALNSGLGEYNVASGIIYCNETEYGTASPECGCTSKGFIAVTSVGSMLSTNASPTRGDTCTTHNTNDMA